MTTITAIIDKAMSTEPYTGKVTMVVLLLNSVDTKEKISTVKLLLSL